MTLRALRLRSILILSIHVLTPSNQEKLKLILCITYVTKLSEHHITDIGVSFKSTDGKY
jgi:hypothetical protein